MESVKDKAERHKLAAELFLKENKKVFITDVEDNLYFADILFAGESTLRIECFGPEQRKGERFTLYYILIEKILPYEEKEGRNGNLS